MDAVFMQQCYERELRRFDTIHNFFAQLKNNETYEIFIYFGIFQ